VTSRSQGAGQLGVLGDAEDARQLDEQQKTRGQAAEKSRKYRTDPCAEMRRKSDDCKSWCNGEHDLSSEARDVVRASPTVLERS
jgi:hypothetical protein